jgi:hypothetical protein
MYSISSSLSLSFISPRALSVIYICICIRVQRNIRKKKRKNRMCAQHAWKPLVERRVHIETNKHIHRLCLFLHRQRTKTKMVEKKKQKKNLY